MSLLSSTCAIRECSLKFSTSFPGSCIVRAKEPCANRIKASGISSGLYAEGLCRSQPLPKPDIIKHFAAFCQHFVLFSPKMDKRKNKTKQNKTNKQTTTTTTFFHMELPPASYSVISHNHSNRFSPNVCQYVSTG